MSIVNSGATGSQVNLGGAYAQSFDSLASTITSRLPWNDNSTLPGWYVYRRLAPIDVYYMSSGQTFDLGSLGGSGQTDRALGCWVGQYSGDYIHFGVQFVNASSSPVTGLDISFDGERWYYGERLPGVTEFLEFSYQVFKPGRGNLGAASGWIAVPDLDFVSTVSDTQPMRRALNGNLPANRVEGIATSLTELTLAPGEEIWLRWTATDTLRIMDDVLAIDYLLVQFHAIPEPATCVALAGGAALMFALSRRRR